MNEANASNKKFSKKSVLPFCNWTDVIFFSDPSQYPDWAGTSDNGLLSDLAPPVFSSFTLKQSRNYKLKVGDIFEASREALFVHNPAPF